MPTNQQRREAERRRLQRQLEQRRAREISRRRMTLILSIVATLVVIAVVVIVVVASTGSDTKKNTAGGEKDTISGSPSTPSPSASSATPTAPAVSIPTAPCAAAPKGATASFRGLTVTGAKDLKHEPKVTGKSAAAPSALSCEDLVVGKGKPASASSNVTVQYVGVLYNTGKVFQSSWSTAAAPAFSLSSVIPGFKQGIGGAGKVAPMRVGGRRIMLLPSALAYGPNAQQGIPANSTLVFVVDLQKIAG